jgi:hypothetical protein
MPETIIKSFSGLYSETIIEGELQKRSIDYVPYNIIREAKEKYDQKMENMSLKPDDQIKLSIMVEQVKLYSDVVSKLPQKLFEFQPKNLNNRIKEIATKMLRLNLTDKDPYELLFNDRSFECVLRTLYRTKREGNFRPVDMKKFYENEKNNYVSFKLGKLKLYLDEPIYKRRQFKDNKKNLDWRENIKDRIKDIKKNIHTKEERNKMIEDIYFTIGKDSTDRYRYLPPIPINYEPTMTDSVVNNRKEILTMTRLYKEKILRKENTYDLAEKINIFKEKNKQLVEGDLLKFN